MLVVGVCKQVHHRKNVVNVALKRPSSTCIYKNTVNYFASTTLLLLILVPHGFRAPLCVTLNSICSILYIVTFDVHVCYAFFYQISVSVGQDLYIVNLTIESWITVDA